MPCACQKKNGSVNRTWSAYDSTGKKLPNSYRTEIEAAAAAQRVGGTYRSNS